MTCVLEGKGEGGLGLETQRHREKGMCNGGRDWSRAATGGGHQGSPEPPAPVSMLPSAESIMLPRELEASMLAIRPVVRRTGIKKIARNAARPIIFWLRRIAMKREKNRIIGISMISPVTLVIRVSTKVESLKALT